MSARNSLPKISIITPSFNQGDFIEQTIASILDQNYPNFELIVIDGGSMDNTVEVIKKYDKHLAYWVSEKDRGQSHAINKGIAKATGEIFNWLNSDDYLEPGALDIVGNTFRDSEKLSVFGDCRHFENMTNRTIGIHHTRKFESTEKTIVRYGMNQPSHYYNIRVIREMNGVDEVLKYGLDMDLWISFLIRYGAEKAIYVPKLLSHFRYHKDSKTIDLQPQFKYDTNAIHHTILEGLDAPEFIIDHFKYPINKSYHKTWDFDQLDRVELLLQFAYKVLEETYDKRDYESCKKCLTFISENTNDIEASAKSIEKKLRILPTGILNIIRNIKNN